MAAKLKMKLVPIGNSRGLRFPKAVLEQAGISDDVDVAIEGGAIVIRPAGRRAGWREAIAAAGPPPPVWSDDELHVMTEWERTEWNWPASDSKSGSSRSTPRKVQKSKRARPCVIISPDELNEAIRTVIVAPLTSRTHPFPSRVRCRFDGVQGEVALDHLRSIDKMRLRKRLGVLAAGEARNVSNTLCEMFGE